MAGINLSGATLLLGVTKSSALVAEDLVTLCSVLVLPPLRRLCEEVTLLYFVTSSLTVLAPETILVIVCPFL